ncbi:MAG: hypothetical protein K2P81_06965 [Bacteriovoracaceae bacterium]|nr:hypothetical protein [Bacteriovoracaceae bacterium]
MQIQLILTLFILSIGSVWAAPSETEIKALFERYDQVIEGKKISFNDVFTVKFIKESGGEKAIRSGWEKEKKTNYTLQITPGRKDKDLVFVKRIPAGEKSVDSSFIVVNKSGKWLIEGTISDEND